MSFIGPRPLLPVDQTAGASPRHLVRPGLTGYAQVVGGRDIPPADKMALDIWYVMNASVALDIEIVMRTVPFVLFGEHVDHEAIRTAWSDIRGGAARRPTGTRYFSWMRGQRRAPVGDRREHERNIEREGNVSGLGRSSL